VHILALCILDYLAGLQARSADTQAFRHAIYERPHVLQVRQPAAFGNIVGMGDFIAELGLFSTNFTLAGHGGTSKSDIACQKARKNSVSNMQ
jgi:hypothetical protein